MVTFDLLSTAKQHENQITIRKKRRQGREGERREREREGEKINCYCQETQHKIHKLVASTSDHA